MNEQLPNSGKMQRIKFIRKAVRNHPFLTFFAVLTFLVTAIVHIYGPYKGKVVDLETGKPLEGAAVLMVFYTVSFYDVSAYGGAVETLTDATGEFYIPWYLALTFHPFSIWESLGYVTVFKPGYGAYPRHPKALPIFEVGGTLPESQYVTIRLPLLKTIEERRRHVASHPNIPKRKMKNLLRLEKEEMSKLY